MRDIKNILVNAEVVNPLAITQSLTDENLYFILRNEHFEVVLYDYKRYVKANKPLTVDEVIQIGIMYPNLKIGSYIVDYDLKTKLKLN